MALNPLQKQTYDSETENNFRWHFWSPKSPRVLSSADTLDEAVHLQLSEIGEYAEIAHGSVSPSFVFQNLKELCSPRWPLEDYGALKRDGARLVCHFEGKVAGVQGYVAFRPVTQHLIVAFSGTSTPAQAMKDMQTWRTSYPHAEGSTVHAGFWAMYQGVRSHAYDALQLGFREFGSKVTGVVLTGHSMGCTMCYLLALDLITGRGQEESGFLRGLNTTLAVFGSPRLGDKGLAKYWQICVKEYIKEFGQGSFVEYSVKGYNDGVPTLPPRFLGFRHLTESPLYFYHGRLFRIPGSENEHGAFVVDAGTESTAENGELVAWPRGGHNYYNDRDMEKLQRSMRWMDVLQREPGWRERYISKLSKWELKWRADVPEQAG